MVDQYSSDEDGDKFGQFGAGRASLKRTLDFGIIENINSTTFHLERATDILPKRIKISESVVTVGSKFNSNPWTIVEVEILMNLAEQYTHNVGGQRKVNWVAVEKTGLLNRTTSQCSSKHKYQLKVSLGGNQLLPPPHLLLSNLTGLVRPDLTNKQNVNSNSESGRMWTDSEMELLRIMCSSPSFQKAVTFDISGVIHQVPDFQKISASQLLSAHSEQDCKTKLYDSVQRFVNKNVEPTSGIHPIKAIKVYLDSCHDNKRYQWSQGEILKLLELGGQRETRTITPEIWGQMTFRTGCTVNQCKVKHFELVEFYKAKNMKLLQPQQGVSESLLTSSVD